MRVSSLASVVIALLAYLTYLVSRESTRLISRLDGVFLDVIVAFDDYLRPEIIGLTELTAVENLSSGKLKLT